ncbi:MAG TPA: glycosyltransferase [Anaeromyxobacteraceae bacterium]|nr:glycosyltransferase [Anaeromyxobacteraceae bacterium]
MAPSIAVLIPCLDEAATIAAVVRGMRAALPAAAVYVYDNGSADGTSECARAAGAIVRSEPLRGKGNVVRRMFADVDADVYVLVDGDGTYDCAAAPLMVQRLLDERLDLVNGVRVTNRARAYRAGHRLGNVVLTFMVARVFGDRSRDLLTGYRVLSRRFVKSFPAIARGFEIETELTVHALGLRMPLAEVETHYEERPEGSRSKLNTFRDGLRILRAILRLVKDDRPLLFFTTLAALLAATSVVLAWPILEEYGRTGLVPRFPTAILSTGIMILACLALTSGLVLDSVSAGRREAKRLRYLEEKAPGESGAEGTRSGGSASESR